MALKEMYKKEIEPHNLFCVDNSRIQTLTHTHASMSLQLGNERHDILVWALNKQRFMYYIW